MGALFALLGPKGMPVGVVEPSAQRRENRLMGHETFEPGGADHVGKPQRRPVEKRPHEPGETPPKPGGERLYDIAIIAVNKELVSEYIKFVTGAGTVLMFSGLSSDEMSRHRSLYSIHYRPGLSKGSLGMRSAIFRLSP